MSVSSRVKQGVAVLVLLAVLDVSWLVLSWLGVLSERDAPPLGVLLVFVVLGVVTWVTARPALRGHRGAAGLLVASRVVSALLADLPALFFDAPRWVEVIVVVAIVLTVVGLWWTAPLLRRSGVTVAHARTAGRAGS